jgi:MFS family permease
MRIDPRIAAVGFLLNIATFFAWTVVPSWARYEDGARPWMLGLLPVGGGLTYVATALRAGALSDRMSRVGLARIGIGCFALFCVLAWWAADTLAIAGLAVLNGFGMALVWPALQARIADEATAEDLEKRLGEFSLSWSAGKTAGFLAFSQAEGAGATGLAPLLGCAALALLLVPLLPRATGRRGPARLPLVRDDLHPPALRAAHLRAGWISNFAAYGLGSTVLFLYPDLLASEGRPRGDQGFVLGTVYGAQTLGFWVFGRWAGWRYRTGPLLGWMAAGCAALLVLGSGAPLALGVPAAALLGLALGQAYSASVYYSVHSEEARGARAGVHEAVIGASDFGMPLLGGQAASATGWSPAPYVAAVAVSGVAMTFAARAVRRAALPRGAAT